MFSYDLDGEKISYGINIFFQLWKAQVDNIK